MLSGEDNDNCEKTTIGLISKKETLHVQHTFFVHFFAIVLHDFNVKLPETSQLHVLWRKCRTCSCSLFFHRRSFSPRWPLAFLIFSPPLRNFHVVLIKKCLLCFFISRSSPLSLFFLLSFGGLSPTSSFSLSFSFSIFQICGHDSEINLSLILQTTRVQTQFLLSVFFFIDS